MCLLTPKRTRRIAEEDIHVWKIVKLTEDKKHWDGPFFDANLPFDEVSEVEPPEEEDIKTISDGRLKCERGFFHSTINYQDAKYEFSLMKLGRTGDGRVYRLTLAVIPKGSVYYIGKRFLDQDEDTAIASNKLIVYEPKDCY